MHTLAQQIVGRFHKTTDNWQGVSSVVNLVKLKNVTIGPFEAQILGCGNHVLGPHEAVVGSGQSLEIFFE